jgi:hypothetical protein
MAGEIADFTSKEQEIFDKEWDSFVATHVVQRDITDMYEDNKAQILDAAKTAKYQLEVDFGGIHAKTNEFGWQEIHPNVLLGTTSRSTAIYSENTWKKNYTSANVSSLWNDWIGSSTSDLQVSKYGTLIIIGFADMVDVPKVHAIKAKIKGMDYPIWYMQNAMEVPGSYHVYELPKPIVIEKEQNMYLQVKVVNPGDDALRPIGVYFTRGDQLRSKTAYAQV